MSTLPGGDVASSSSSVTTIEFLGAGQTGERMAERLPADGLRVRLCARRAEVQRSCSRPSRGEGQWAAARNAGESVANPVRSDETPVPLTRAPRFAEHTKEAVRELGLSEQELIQPKSDGAATHPPADPFPTNPLPIANIG